MQTLGLHLEDLIPVKHLWVCLAAFVLDGDTMVSKLGKIASGLYVLLENKLENLKLENLKNLKT